ncbi:MAG TPA: YciI family protein [Verrucomicrobiae bacterium]|nr:YciI family protein [Verrucomicrobiae bacterium]
MSKQHYFFKLISPRPTFPHDITEKEKALMDEHARYFQKQFQAGKVLLYGPVMASAGAFGVGILEVADEAEARQFAENDPSVLGGLNRWEIHPMHVTDARAKG